MVVKAKKQHLPKQYVFNAAVALFFLTTGLLVLRSTFHTETAAACSERYQTATVFALEDGYGAQFSPLDLQSQLNGDDWGLADHLAIARSDVDGETVPAMQIRLPGTAATGGTIRQPGGGVGFSWEPDLIQGHTKGCLSYSVRLPQDFPWEQAGILPGFYGEYANTIADDGLAAKVLLPMRWFHRGKFGFGVHDTAPDGRRTNLIIPARGAWLPRGRWFRVDQEIALNSPGKSDGVMRLWIDGELAHEFAGLKLYKGDDVPRLRGVLGGVHFAELSTKWRRAPAPTQIGISSFTVSRP